MITVVSTHPTLITHAYSGRELLADRRYASVAEIYLADSGPIETKVQPEGLYKPIGYRTLLSPDGAYSLQLVVCHVALNPAGLTCYL